jgi:G3E family GTPase
MNAAPDSTRILIVGSVDPRLRADVALGLLADTPDLVVIQQDLDPGRVGQVRRVTHTQREVVSDAWVDLDHLCLTCGSSDDAVAAIRRAVDALSPANVALLIPVSTPTVPVATSVAAATANGILSDCRLSGVVAACDVASFEEDLFGDQLLIDRRQHILPDDNRCVGEVLAAMTEHSDFVITSSSTQAGTTRASALLDHIRANNSHRLDHFLTHDLSRLFSHTHHTDTASRRIDPLCVAPTRSAETAVGTWTLSLTSDRPFHPERLLDRIEDLGSGRFRSRGHFWLPTRPFTACVWDGAGGHLSLGAAGDWERRTPATTLVFAGTGPERQAVIEAFDDALLTPEESRRSPQSWMDAVDEFDPWLGSRS